QVSRFLYNVNDEILLVGEGNCSFSRALVEKFEVGDKITCTTYDTYDVLKTKYGDEVDGFIQQLIDSNARVQHGIDATKLHEAKKLARSGEETAVFDTIVFNFPHTGAGIKNTERNILANQEMLTNFFESAYKVLSEKGEIHLTIKLGEPYSQWRVAKLAERATDLYLKNSQPFDCTLYPGYEHRRTIGFDEGKSKAGNHDIEKGARTYVFVRDTERRIQEQKVKDHPRNKKRERKDSRVQAKKRTHHDDDSSDDGESGDKGGEGDDRQDNDIHKQSNAFEKVKFTKLEMNGLM
ncbi:hypothetical protein SARC_10959, partial [Sphaeroforma arctica JP610]